MRSALQRATLGVVAAIAITTAMDATGLSAFSALPLFPLMGLLWYLEKHSRQDIGLVGGRPLGYGLAILYPTLVLGAVGGISAASGALDAAQIDWSGAWRKVAIVSAATVVVALITEEGILQRLALRLPATRRSQRSCNPGREQPGVLTLAFVGRHAQHRIRSACGADPRVHAQRSCPGVDLGPVAGELRFDTRQQRQSWTVERRCICVLSDMARPLVRQESTTRRSTAPRWASLDRG
jgi:hypothetical protein